MQTETDSPDYTNPILSVFLGQNVIDSHETGRTTRRARTKKVFFDQRTPEKPVRKKSQCRRAEEDSNDQIHNRVMQILYHLEQKQDTLLSLLENVSSAAMPPDKDVLESDICTVRETLVRLTNVFKVSKEELNCSTSNIRSDDLKRKQLQLNTRITKCSSLSKAQDVLEEKVKVYLESATADISSRAESVMTDNHDDSYSFCGSQASCPDALPFSQPLYSQNKSDLLDEILTLDLTKPREFCQSPQTSVTSVTFHGDKMFVSPPKTYLNRSPSCQSQTPMDSSFNFVPFLHQAENTGHIVEQPMSQLLPISTSTQVSSCIMESAQSQEAIQLRKKLYKLSAKMKVNIISNSELKPAAYMSLPHDFWNGNGFISFEQHNPLFSNIDDWD